MKIGFFRWVSCAALILFALLLELGYASPPDTAAASISQLSWLNGYWAAGEGDASSEEFWLPASENLMLGLHRDIFAPGKTFFEFLRIAETADGLSYFASPRGRPATEFKAIRIDSASVTFEKSDHDYPQRIIYTLVGDTTLLMRIEGMVKGKLKSSEWRLYRSNLPSGK